MAVSRYQGREKQDTGLRGCEETGHGLLGQVDGRDSIAVLGWPQRQSPEFRDAIEIVALDPSPYAPAAVRQALPNATIAVDHFHLVVLGNPLRQRVTRDLLGRRDRVSQTAFTRM